MTGSRVTGGSHGERCYVCHPFTGCRNTDGTPKLETNNLSVPSETVKSGLTIKLLESQRQNGCNQEQAALGKI